MRILGHFDGDIWYGPPPDWIQAAEINPRPSPAVHKNTRFGVWNLLSDLQHNLEEKVYYHRQVSQLLTQVGVQEGSRYEIEFDPQYDLVTIHTIELQRNGEIIDLAPELDVHVFNLEEGLERHMLDGRLKAVLLLTDTRINDIIDFSYSIGSRQDRFENEPRQGRFILRGLFSAEWIRRRLLYSSDREVFTVPINYEAEPTFVTDTNGMTSCEWNERNQKPLQLEDNLPSWIEPFSVVQYGELSTWREVAQWFLPIYATPEELPPSLATEVRRIRDSSSLPSEQICSALRFVQDHIRYVSVCLGEHTARPHDVDTIMKRRYGDCKDKSLLLVTILRTLGIDAAPALVNTVRRQQIADMLPSPWAFDHVITHILHEGRSYWIDPVMKGQRGTFERLYCPEYGLALVLSPETEYLLEMETSGAPNLRKHIDEFFCGRVNQLTEYKATRLFEGASADMMRMILANNTEEQVGRDFLSELLPLYPGIEIAKPWWHVDKEKENRIELHFEYLIKNLWQPIPGHTPHLFASFRCLGLDRLLYRPLTKKRTHPFAIPHPVEFEQEINVKTLHSFGLAHKNIAIRCPNFECKGFIKTQSALFHLDFRYTSKKDHVAPDEVSKYLESCDQLLPLLTKTLVYE